MTSKEEQLQEFFNSQKILADKQTEYVKKIEQIVLQYTKEEQNALASISQLRREALLFQTSKIDIRLPPYESIKEIDDLEQYLSISQNILKPYRNFINKVADIIVNSGKLDEGKMKLIEDLIILGYHQDE